MKILIVAVYVAPHVGGIEVVAAQQAASLAASGHDVTILTSRYEKTLPLEERVDGYRVVRTPAWNALERRTAVPYPFWGIRSWSRIVRLVRQADVVHVHDVYYQPTIWASLVTRLLRRPMFVTQHVSMVEHDNGVVMAVQRLVYRTIGARIWRWSRWIVAYNTIVRQFLVERGVPPEKVLLSYNGIDTDRFRPGTAEDRSSARQRFELDPERPIVLFVGRLVPKKGFRELVASADPNYQIVLVGPGPIPEQVPENVVFLGSIDRAELIRLYQASDILAMPATGEMLTLAMQEAMACGLPIVATADPAYDEYDLDAGNIAFVPVDPAVLRRTFLTLLEDGDRRGRMSTYSRQLAVQRFDWRRNADDLAGLYQLGVETPLIQTADTVVNSAMRVEQAS